MEKFPSPKIEKSTFSSEEIEETLDRKINPEEERLHVHTAESGETSAENNEAEKIQHEAPTHKTIEIDPKEQLQHLETLLKHPNEYEEAAEAFVSYYRERYARHEYPPEHERLAYLQKFVKDDVIKEMVEERTRVDWKDYLSPGRRKRISELRKKLEQEKQVLETAQENDTPLPDSWQPAIIGNYVRQRHHADGGAYMFSYDSYGNTYFQSPDGQYLEKRYAELYGEYVNLAQFPRSDYSSRILAEDSHTVDSSKITADDCERIDPMPVPDAKRSYASAAIFNLFTGCSDATIAWSRHEKNQRIRKDGVYYLFDISAQDNNWNELNATAQFEELQLFFDDMPDQERSDIFSYMADTAVVLMSTKDPLRASSYEAYKNRGYFLENLITYIESSSLKDEYKKELTEKITRSVASFTAYADKTDEIQSFSK